jgi:hypothetical protein
MSNAIGTDNEMSTREEREELAEKTAIAPSKMWMQRYSAEWKEVLGMVLEKCYADANFFARVIREIHTNKLANGKVAQDMIASFHAGIAVYGKLSTKTPPLTKLDGNGNEIPNLRKDEEGNQVPKRSQFETAMQILRQHPTILVSRFAADVGIVVDDEEGEKVPF